MIFEYWKAIGNTWQTYQYILLTIYQEETFYSRAPDVGNRYLDIFSRFTLVLSVSWLKRVGT